jgi:uncharacterized protein (DUF1501 family)
MLRLVGDKQSFCDGISRRNFLQVGALGIGGLTLADVLRAKAAQGPSASNAHKACIMIYLPGGPTHMDTYDLKPDAPKEYRGEFSPIRTAVPGVGICELMPRQAKIMDKLAVLRGVRTVDDHSSIMMMTGFDRRAMRPSFGSVVSRVKGSPTGLPPYVSLMGGGSTEDPQYVGVQHKPFVPSGPGLQNLSLVQGVTAGRLEDRKGLLSSFDSLHREMDARGSMAGMDAFTAKALDMVTSPKARQAFDTTLESAKVKEKYGRDNNPFLQARRLVEAGVQVVTLATGGWDTHGDNFNAMRRQLPRIDQGIHALVTDLHERGLDKDVSVVMWGEFGRTPRINNGAGRDHWSYAGFCLMAGGGFKTGQAVGETDARGERAKGTPITPQNILATIYHGLGVDPSTTLLDGFGRPMYLLEDRKPVEELV